MSNKGKRLPAEVLTDDEVRLLIEACSPKCPTGIRNRALIAALYRSGLRIAEALALKPKDMNAADGTIRVLRGKGGRARTVGIDPGASAIIALWAAVRSSRGLGGSRPLFCTLKGTALATAYVRALLPRLRKKAGIRKRVHAHGLRHTFASQLLNEGESVGVISKALGHGSIATTDCYLNHIAPLDTINAVRNRNWTP